MLTWRCGGCGVLRVDDVEPLRCACGVEWCPLTAPIAEVDAHVRALGIDPGRLRAEGEALARQLTGREVLA